MIGLPQPGCSFCSAPFSSSAQTRCPHLPYPRYAPHASLSAPSCGCSTSLFVMAISMGVNDRLLIVSRARFGDQLTQSLVTSLLFQVNLVYKIKKQIGSLNKLHKKKSAFGLSWGMGTPFFLTLNCIVPP